jgi:5-methylcytosine-specific restriction protein B
MEKLSTILNQYYDQFPDRWIEQKYIWKCVQTFQTFWDINADDFSSMIAKATIDADYLMNASLYYPREMIVSLAKYEPQGVRKMFEILFDEERPVNERASVFNETADRLRYWYKGMCFRRNYQTMNAISTYLWLKYPDKYYFYKYSVGKAVSSATGIYYADQRDSEVDKMTKEFALLDQISGALRQDNRFRKLLDERLDKTLYSDEQMHCMAIDFSFFIRPCYQNRKLEKKFD